MSIRPLGLAALLMLALPSAHAQVSLHIDIGLPVRPPLVVVEPGVQVVEGFDDEVFFYSGWYWCRRPNGWYRARGPRARFEWVEVGRVPRTLVRIPEGRYRNWHHERREEHREREHERREERHERGDRDEGRHGHGDHGRHEGRDH